MPKQKYPVTLTKIDKMTPTVRNFHFEFSKVPRFDFIAGQFVMVERENSEGKLIKKSYSIASPPYFQNKIELCVKKVDGGFMSGWFFTLEEGDETEFIGPMGVFKLKEPLPEHLLFVATGTGIAPLRAQILQLLHEGYSKKISMVLGVRYENEVLFQNEMEELAQQHSNFEFIPIVSRPEKWQGEKGYVQHYLKKAFADPEGKAVYICGLIPMVNDTQQTLLDLGYTKENIHFEKWT